MMAEGLIDVLIVDDHPIVRQGLRSLLATCETCQVVGEAASFDEALDRYRQLEPDVTLLDIRLGDGSGLEVLDELLEIDPGARIVMLSSFDDEEYVHRSLRAGALGYVLKGDSDSTLVNAIEVVAGGRHALSPTITDQLVGQFVGTGPSDQQPFSEFDRQLLRHVSEGASNADIGQLLYMSETSVKRRLGELFRRLGVSRRAEAAAEAARRGLI